MGIPNDEIDDGLTDEERAALAEDDGDDEAEGNEADTEGDGDAEESDGAGSGDDDVAADGDDSGEAGDNGEAASDSGGESVPGQPEGPQSASAPILIAEAPADAEAKLREIATKKDELIAQFDDGDITAKEYQQQLDALAKQEREIERAVDKAQLAAEMEQQRQKNEWISTVNRFIAANPIYSADKNPRLYRALDQEVRDLAGTPEAANWTGEQILAKAHENLSEAFGLGKPAAQQQTPAKKTVPKPDLPPTLAKVPAAEGSETGGSKWASLDRLATTDPLGYEEALANMSDADRAAYLASA